MLEGICRTEGCPANGVWVLDVQIDSSCESCWKPLSEIMTAPMQKKANPAAELETEPENV